MRIGIDIDGVLTDMERFLFDYGTKYNVEIGKELDLEVGNYDEAKMFKWTDEEAVKFWNEYLVYYATEYPARTFAAEVIKKLREDGNEVYIVTARNDYGLTKEYIGKMKEMVNGWLEKNNIVCDKIVYTEGSKLPYCVGNYIEVMVEDNPEEALNVSKQIPVLLYDALYNKEIEEDNITRIYSWYDIYDKINKMC